MHGNNEGKWIDAMPHISMLLLALHRYILMLGYFAGRYQVYAQTTLSKYFWFLQEQIQSSDMQVPRTAISSYNATKNAKHAHRHIDVLC